MIDYALIYQITKLVLVVVFIVCLLLAFIFAGKSWKVIKSDVIALRREFIGFLERQEKVTQGLLENVKIQTKMNEATKENIIAMRQTQHEFTAGLVQLQNKTAEQTSEIAHVDRKVKRLAKRVNVKPEELEDVRS